MKYLLITCCLLSLSCSKGSREVMRVESMPPSSHHCTGADDCTLCTNCQVDCDYCSQNGNQCGACL